MKHIRNKYLSIPLIKEIYQRSSLTAIMSNTGWLVIDKGINLVVGLLVGVWVARFLGPVDFGKFNYAIAFVALFASVVPLGLNMIAVRNIVREPAKIHDILGTTLILQFVVSLVVCGLSIATAFFLFPGDDLLHRLVIIVALGAIFQVFSNPIGYWFQAQLQSKYSVWARNTALILASLAKIILILRQAPLTAFAWAATCQGIIFTIGLFVFYTSSGQHVIKWKFNLEQVKNLMKDSWPLIISDLAIMIYMKSDQLMLGSMASSEALGVYSAAVRLSELWYFIPIALATSFFPAIVRSRENKSQQVYRERTQLFFDMMAVAAYMIVIPLSFAAKWLVLNLYGVEYAAAGDILRIHIWAFLFVSLGVAQSQWLLTEKMTKFSMVATFVGAMLNVGLNFLLIPRYAGVGAAWSTLISYAISGYLFSLFYIRTWPVFRQQSLSLIMPLRMRSIIIMFGKTVLKNE
jgi:O-antigen/teichoic acid export membrane protein